MVQRGPDYLSAATSYESNVIRWNANNPNLIFPFVLIYPREGTFWNEHPMCIVEGATWSTPKQQEAAQKFIDFVLEKEQQEATVKYGIRPADSSFDPSRVANSPFSESNGVLPVTSETIASLPYPTDDVTNAIIQLWIDTKKPASILLIIDVSGSMQEQNKITYAKQAAASFVNQMHDRDEIHVLTFSSTYNYLLPDADNNTLSVIRSSMAVEISLLFPGGGTALFDSTVEGVRFMNELKTSRAGTSQRYNYAVVLMTDGVDTSSTQYTFSSMMASLPNGESSDQIHIFTVAYGSDADKDSLAQVSYSTRSLGNTHVQFYQIAARTNGKAYVASTTNILSIYSDIVLEF
jgi:Ca-activated chloride channel family protein